MKRISKLFFLVLISTLVSHQLKAENVADHIDLVIQFDNDFEKHYSKIRYTQEMTVLNAMQQMQKHPRATPFKVRGKGTSTFLFEIDSIANQGNGKNWIYYVNGKRATVGIGAKKLNPRDHILWKYEPYR